MKSSGPSGGVRQPATDISATGMMRTGEMTHVQAFNELLDSIGVTEVISRGQHALERPLGDLKRVADKAKAATLDPLKSAAHKLTDPLAKISQEELKRAVQLLRSRFGGLDDSLSSQNARARQLQKYLAVYDPLADHRLGGVPINDLEEIFTQAKLYEARTEVGRLSYEADTDGNGALDFGEFCVVLDKLTEYHMHKQGSLQPDSRGSFLFGTEGASLTMKQVIWHTLEEPSFSRLSRLMGALLFSSIALGIIVYVLQSVPYIEVPNRDLFHILEEVCLVVFSLEYLARLFTCPSLWAHLTSMSHAIDIGTLLPYYVDLVYAVAVPGSSGNNAIMRVLRIIRVFRIFKVAKYVPYVGLMTASAAAAAAPILMAVFVMLIGMVLLAFSIYFSERGAWSPALELYTQADGTISPFQSIADASYWAIVTLTSVGYGDLVPKSPLGKLVGAITAMSGYIIVAFPVSIYTEEFSKEYVELVKVKALQAELGQDDLCERLLAARKAVLSGPAPRLFPTSSSLTDTLSPAVPRNLALSRKSRRQQFDRMTDALLKGSALDSDLLAPEDIRPPKPVPFVRTPFIPKEVLKSKVFAAIWLGDTSIEVDEEEETIIYAKPDLVEPQAEQTAGSGVQAADGLSDASTGRSRGRRGSMSTSGAAAGRRASMTGGRAGSASSGGKRRRNSLMVDGHGEGLANMFGSSGATLRAASFTYLDLTSDADLSTAILALISDKRKQVWTQVRVLESRFRDDISTEVARRWQSWMGMPRDYVRDVAAPFVFRQKDLKRGLAFSRHDLRVGFLRKETGDAVSGARSHDPATGGQSYVAQSRARQLNVAGHRVAENFRSLVHAPSAAAAQAVLNATGEVSRMAVEASVDAVRAAAGKGVTVARAGVEQMKAQAELVRGRVIDEMAHALDPLAERQRDDPRNYRARLAAEYGEALALDKEERPRPRDASASGEEGVGILQSASLSKGGMVQTPFGMSAVLPQTKVISSSVGTGMASIAGSGALPAARLVDEYRGYYSRVFVAPLQSEDGDQVVFSKPAV